MVKTKVILDTNFLMYCAENKIDYKDEIERIMAEGHDLVTLEQVVNELKQLAEKSKKYTDKSAAKLSLKLLAANFVEIIKAEGDYADRAIINLVKSSGAIVATIDKQLRKRLGRQNRAIVIEGKRKVAWN